MVNFSILRRLVIAAFLLAIGVSTIRSAAGWQSAAAKGEEKMTTGQLKYKTSDEIDFVIIGSGAAGGVIAKELSTNGFSVVVLEQGPYHREADFTHDEIQITNQYQLTNKLGAVTNLLFTGTFARFKDIRFIKRHSR